MFMIHHSGLSDCQCQQSDMTNLLTLTGWLCITPHSTSLTSPCLCSIESVATVAGVGGRVVECSIRCHDLSIGDVVKRTTVNS